MYGVSGTEKVFWLSEPINAKYVVFHINELASSTAELSIEVFGCAYYDCKFTFIKFRI